VSEIYLAPRQLQPELLIPHRKPTGRVVIDRAHPFGKTLKFYGFMTSDGMLDLVTNTLYQLPNSAGPATNHNGNLAALYDGVTFDTLDLPIIHLEDHIVLATNCTKLTNESSGATILHFNGPDDNRRAIFGWFFQTFDPEYVLQSTSFTAARGATGALNLPVTLSANLSVDIGAPQREARGFANGIFDAVDTDVDSAETYNFFDQLEIGGDSGGDLTHCHIEFIALWVDKWTDAQHAKFAIDPYQFLKPVGFG
jgi:hypothetical protein